MKTTQPTLTNLLALHVIALTIGGHPAYLARKGAEWDGAWFTRDIGNARTYKRETNAHKQIADYGTAWATLAPRVEIKSLVNAS